MSITAVTDIDLPRWRVLQSKPEIHVSPPTPLLPDDTTSQLYEPRANPYLLAPGGYFDVDLNAFFSDVSVQRLAISTLLNYATDIARFFDFLWHARSGGNGSRRSWRDANEEDRSAFFHWRNVDPEGPRIAASTWAREVEAVNSFYTVQVETGRLAVSPIRQRALTKQPAHHSRRSTTAAEKRPRRGQPRAAWLSPREYELYRNGGMRGYLPDGTRDGDFVGRQSSRNCLFTDLMFGTGLRLREQASLLVGEIPSPDSTQAYLRMHVPEAIAKNGSARRVYVEHDVVNAIALYIETGRDDAVEAGNRSGLYESIPNKIILTHHQATQYVTSAGITAEVHMATEEMRSRMFIRTDDGWEPAMLWLTERGKPMTRRGWQTVFAQANARLARHGQTISCHPHMLRHSWATITLAILHRRYAWYEERQRLDKTFRVPYLGEAIVWVSERLGHRQLETTHRYLHNLQELEGETLMNMIPDDIDYMALPRTDDPGDMGDFLHDDS